MKVPLEWLKEYVTIRLSPDGLAERLTMAGLEVTGIEKSGADAVLDLEITPNRADCLSILGIAREVAAMTGQTVKFPGASGARRVSRAAAVPSAPPSQQPVVRIEDRKSCERYIGRLLVGVRIGPSPDWMQRRLLACGARLINNIVDITNYVLLEYGQPLHAFDFYRLAQGTILVRRAQPEERITTLDGVARTLTSDMLVIADAKHAVAVAGVMGGTDSAVSDQTRDVLLESALFDAVSIRRTARKLGLASDSSYRFERGVDPGGVDTASVRAAALIQELAGGREFAVLDVGTKPSKRTGIILDGKRLTQWLGTPVPEPVIRSTLVRLGCHVASSGAGGSLHVGVPSSRRDLTQDVDLMEEVARLFGYDRIPATLPATTVAAAGRTEESSRYWRVQSLRCLCASLGLTETVSWALVSAQDLTRCGFVPAEAARLANPLSQDHAYLRPSLVLGMLRTLRQNLARGAEDVQIFEVGGVVPPAARAEEVRLGMALTGWWLRDWRTRQSCDFWVLKGLLHALLGRLCEGTPQFAPASQPWAAAGECAEIRLGGRTLGWAGRVAEAIAEGLDLKPGMWAAEVSVDAMLAAKRSPSVIQVPTAFPAVKRDISLLADDATPYEQVERTIRDVAGALAAQVALIDRFTKGAAIPSGKYSVTFSIDYQDASRTLTAEEVDAVHARVGAALVERIGATLR